MKRLRDHLIRRGQIGQSIIILALGMIGLLGFVGLTTDVSILFVRYSTLRRAVDSAAIAAAGQMREDRSVASVSLTARQFIEFHGLNPRDVWVETCHIQPREDQDPTREGLQHAPTTVLDAQDTVDTFDQQVQQAIEDGLADDAIKTRVENAHPERLDYFAELENWYPNNFSSEVQTAKTNFENAWNDFQNDRSNANMNAYQDAYEVYREEIEEEAFTTGDDPELCTADQRKLVRVTAQLESPTVFLSLLGWDDILLQAEAISETAVMDVVLVMDVSESMLTETTYNDWAKVNLGTAYVPPYLADVTYSSTSEQSNDSLVIGQMAADNWLPMHPDTSSYPNTIDFRDQDRNNPGSGSPAFGDPYQDTAWDTNTTAGDPSDAPPTTARDWFPDWFWQDHILGNWQKTINDRLYFQNPDGSSAPNLGDPQPASPNPRPDDEDNEYYQVESFVPQSVRDEYGANQGHPREGCRVRYYPFSATLSMTETWPEYNDGNVSSLAELYATDPNLDPGDGAGLENEDWLAIENYNDSSAEQPRFSGFVPTYNFYGCCNDPSNADVNDEGEIVDSSGNPWTAQNASNDGKFNDLVCQPFKDARDATRQFLDRIDFLRGDRVAFVTFDRTAFLIDRDGNRGATTHMIEDLQTAKDTLNELIGVRAEPNYYLWDEENGGWGDAIDHDNDASTPDKTYTYSAGYDSDSGSYVPLDYNYLPGGSNPENSGSPAAVNYPVYGSCFIQNAELPYPYSLYASRNVDPSSGSSPYNGNPALFNVVQPNIGDFLGPWNPNPNRGTWSSQVNVESGVSPTLYTYEKASMCRGTNVGAALREANAALTDPTTSRREGTVWVIILISDGAAGASDPVRRDGDKLNTVDPYEEVEAYNWRERNDSTDPSQGRYGSTQPAGYGAYGLCPYGNVNNTSRLGELIEGEPLEFPWCSDADPISRHFCLQEDDTAVGYEDPTDLSQTSNSFGTGFDPQSADKDYINTVAVSQTEYENNPDTTLPPMPNNYPGGMSAWILDQNVERGNIFEVDIGDITDTSNPCDPLYDVDDYARDWADFVTGIDEEDNGDALLPTIFTIGFGLDFSEGDNSCEDNPGDCLGEELLRYIADAGDNFRIDNDIQQDLRDNADEWRSGLSSVSEDYPTLDGSVGSTDEGWGPKGPCESEDLLWRGASETGLNNLETRTPGESCGNYFNAPSATELDLVFDEIASRLFTRLAG